MGCDQLCAGFAESCCASKHVTCRPSRLGENGTCPSQSTDAPSDGLDIVGNSEHPNNAVAQNGRRVAHGAPAPVRRIFDYGDRFSVRCSKRLSGDEHPCARIRFPPHEVDRT
jgi:hypothetical protein